MLGIKNKIKIFMNNIYVPFIWLKNNVNIEFSTDNNKILYNIFKTIKKINSNSLVIFKYKDILHITSNKSIYLYNIQQYVSLLNNIDISILRNSNHVCCNTYNNKCDVYKYSYYDESLYKYVTKLFYKPDHMFYDLSHNYYVQFNQLVI